MIIGGYSYYSHDAGTGNAGRGRGVQGAPPVKVAAAHQQEMPVIEKTIGTVVANSTVSVTARVQGQLTKAYFKEGQMVKEGDLLFQIDPSPFQAAYDATLATLAGAKTNADRSAALLKQNAIAPQTNDNNQSVYDQAKANAEAARLNLQFTQIRSPITGKTGPILLQPGNLVSVNGLTAPLVTITQVQPIKVSFALPQVDLPRIQARAHTAEGLTAVVALHDAGGDQDLAAPVDFISNRWPPPAAPSNCAPASPMPTWPWCRANWWMWWSSSPAFPTPSWCRARRSIWGPLGLTSMWWIRTSMSRRCARSRSPSMTAPMPPLSAMCMTTTR